MGAIRSSLRQAWGRLSGFLSRHRIAEALIVAAILGLAATLIGVAWRDRQIANIPESGKAIHHDIAKEREEDRRAVEELDRKETARKQAVR